MHFCLRCGQALNADMRFCGSCGTSVRENDSADGCALAASTSRDQPTPVANRPVVLPAIVVPTTGRNQNMLLIVVASAVATIIVAWIYASPYLALRNLKQAAKAGNVGVLREAVDFPALRESLKEELIGRASKKAVAEIERNDNGLEVLGAMLAGGLLNMMIDRFVTPHAIASLVQGKPVDGMPDGLTDLVTRFAESTVSTGYKSFSRFDVHIFTKNPDHPLTLVMMRSSLINWRLNSIRLPDLDGQAKDTEAAPATPAHSAPSFDCAKARSKVEQAICKDSELSKLDAELAIAYKAALSYHPLPSYVRARQVDWLSTIQGVDPKNFVERLREEYRTRIDHLRNASQVVVYSDSEQKFSYAGGDTAVELWQQSDGEWRLSVWGGFVLHRVATEANGRPTFTGCEFEGIVQPPFRREGRNSALSTESDYGITFYISPNTLSLDNEFPGCYGLGRIHSDQLMRVVRR